MEHVRFPDSVVNTVFTRQAQGVSLVHTSKENIHDEMVEELVQSVKRDTSQSVDMSEQTNETQVTLKELQEMKNELIRQSEENITRIVNRNMQTQVHAISDMVYLELEKRLRNEQRRRGY
jgi:hypothetical protein